jgi:DNA repair exonuclease SbcCD ATPase subunit
LENRKLKDQVKKLQAKIDKLELEIEEKDKAEDLEAVCQDLEAESEEKSKEIKFLQNQIRELHKKYVNMDSINSSIQGISPGRNTVVSPSSLLNDLEFSFTENPDQDSIFEDSNYKKQIEKLWKELDNYDKGYLDIDEAKFFMDELCGIIGLPFSNNYN